MGTVTMTKKNISGSDSVTGCLKQHLDCSCCFLSDLMHVLIPVFELADQNLLKWMPTGQGHKKTDLFFLFSESEFCLTCRLLSIITFILKVFVLFDSFSTLGKAGIRV